MEKFSSISQVIGNITEIERKKIIKKTESRFGNQIFEDLEKIEREKTAEELKIIDIINQATNKIRQQYGLDDFDIPAKNIHIISEKDWQEDHPAFYNSTLQAVAIMETPVKIEFVKNVFHELIHFKSYNALQVTSEGQELNEYRSGLVVHDRSGEDTYFANFNEAVVEELTKKYIGEVLNNPIFKEEIEQTKDIVEKYPNSVTGSGELLFDNDTIYAEITNNRISEEEIKEINTVNFTYQDERRILNNLIDKLLKKNSDKFQNRNQIFDLFANGVITGNILPIGRLIDGSFGAGTLRRIGELDQNIKKQEDFINYL